MPQLDSEGKPFCVIMSPSTIRNAEIAFLNEETWAVIGGSRRATGVLKHRPLPQVDCPIIDMRGITNQQLKDKILRKHTSPEGVKDVPALVNDLLKLGGRFHESSIAHSTAPVTILEDNP